MLGQYKLAWYRVHCRTGSLETSPETTSLLNGVHCRTGSLEKLGTHIFQQFSVHCRTGSLENDF